ncbi:hypothetical protein Q0601_19905 [Paracoccus onubensis]|uniref:hypothetical protein n=1 Tax=Paracoccus onubensis TaxID=1675788 RepID=UPI0027300DFA|nr:hypothetical protein [Paracoccus onubensis]MDP0929457.1 hypothetical protein [Paracoccus onubensis]
MTQITIDETALSLMAFDGAAHFCRAMAHRRTRVFIKPAASSNALIWKAGSAMYSQGEQLAES